MKEEDEVIGIYKITSPSNRIYIGQSVNINRRFKEYLKLNNCKGQIKLYNSFNKYGVDNHKFEIITLCYKEQLNEFERDFQEAYDVIDKDTGLNCKLTETNDKSGIISIDTRLKMRNLRLGKKASKETKNKMIINNGKSRPVICLLTGKKWSSGRLCAIENKLNINHFNKKLTTNYFNNTFYIYKDVYPIEGVNYNCKIRNTTRKKVINTITNQIWNSISECARENKMNKSHLNMQLLGLRPNNTQITYV